MFPLYCWNCHFRFQSQAVSHSSQFWGHGNATASGGWHRLGINEQDPSMCWMCLWQDLAVIVPSLVNHLKSFVTSILPLGSPVWNHERHSPNHQWDRIQEAVNSNSLACCIYHLREVIHRNSSFIRHHRQSSVICHVESIVGFVLVFTFFPLLAFFFFYYLLSLRLNFFLSGPLLPLSFSLFFLSFLYQMWIWECWTDIPEMKVQTPSNDLVIYHPPAAVLCLEPSQPITGPSYRKLPSAGTMATGLWLGADAGLSGGNEVKTKEESQGENKIELANWVEEEGN